MDISSARSEELIGSKIHFRTYDGEYKGTIKSVFFETKQITIENAYRLPENAYEGNLNFFFYEFLTYKILTINNAAEARKTEHFSASTVNSSEKKCCANILFKESNTKGKFEKNFEAEYTNSNEFILKLPPKLQELLPNDSVILDSIDMEFKMAIKHISSQRAVGVSFLGDNVSRRGTLIWICITTQYCIFLFDIQSLKKDAFDKGLRNIFQSLNIEKIVHDCRRPSDVLFHCFSTTLINVFDTQIADFIIKRQECNSKNVALLDECLEKYLAMPKEFLCNTRKLLSGDQYHSYLSERPVRNECRNVLIKSTVYLILLRQKLTKLMLNSVYEASHTYANAIKQTAALTAESMFPSVIHPALLARGLQIMSLGNDPLNTLACSMSLELKHVSQKVNSTETKTLKRVTDKESSGKSGYHFELHGKTSSGFQMACRTIENGLTKTVSADYGKFRKTTRINNDENSEKSLNSVSCFKKSSEVTLSNNLVPSLDFMRAKHNLDTERKMNGMLKWYDERKTEGSCGESDTHLQNKSKNLSENVLPKITNNCVVENTETWAKLRLAFNASRVANHTAIRNSKKTITFIPSGMDC